MSTVPPSSDSDEKTTDGSEHRRFTRFCLEAEVTVSSQTNFFMGFSENISEGGLFVSTLTPPSRGTKVDLTVNVDDIRTQIEGEVTWHRTNSEGESTGCGVRFVNLTPTQIRVIAELIRRAGREPLFYEV